MNSYKDQAGRWITVKGKKVFIKDGESQEDAFNRTFGITNSDKSKTYKSGDIVELTGDVTGGKKVSDYKDMQEGHNPMSPDDWIDDMGYDVVPTAKNFKTFSEYKDAYDTDGDKASAGQIGKDTITIYRAQSLDYDKNIPYGAWVGLTEKYALEHANNALGGKNYIILKAKVKSSDVVWAGDSFQEWGYFPKDSK